MCAHMFLCILLVSQENEQRKPNPEKPKQTRGQGEEGTLSQMAAECNTLINHKRHTGHYKHIPVLRTDICMQSHFAVNISHVYAASSTQNGAVTKAQVTRSLGAGSQKAYVCTHVLMLPKPSPKELLTKRGGEGGTKRTERERERDTETRRPKRGDRSEGRGKRPASPGSISTRIFPRVHGPGHYRVC
jgi:hypothetical protein